MTTLGTARTIKVEANTWYQIHTNGGTTTFARIYEGQDADGFGCWWFEKMSVDTTVPQGGAEIFGQEDFTSDLTAQNRLERALTEAI
jgi:hypothetical protein